MPKLRVLSLFCGCGGADLGAMGSFTYLGKLYKGNHAEIVHASDINEKAVATYNLNFKHKAQTEDVRKLKFRRGFADVVIGGFPCQSFSTVNPSKEPGNRETQLFWEMANIISMIRPAAIIAENVKGFYRLAGGKYFQMATDEFERLGYTMTCKVINSSDFGVPQLRERIFMVGIRKDLKRSYVFPDATHGVLRKPRKSVLSDVIDNVEGPGPKYIFSQRAVEGVKKAKKNMKRALAQNMSKQCLTITSHLAKVSLNSRDPVILINSEKEKYRRFTPREAARIQSFPDSFNFSGSEADAYRQIGNAIPPVVFWHLFASLRKQMSQS
jgi:DNA (cytosine-5)-methyltransferase 1